MRVRACASACLPACFSPLPVQLLLLFDNTSHRSKGTDTAEAEAAAGSAERTPSVLGPSPHPLACQLPREWPPDAHSRPATWGPHTQTHSTHTQPHTQSPDLRHSLNSPPAFLVYSASGWLLRRRHLEEASSAGSSSIRCYILFPQQAEHPSVRGLPSNSSFHTSPALFPAEAKSKF